MKKLNRINKFIDSLDEGLLNGKQTAFEFTTGGAGARKTNKKCHNDRCERNGGCPLEKKGDDNEDCTNNRCITNGDCKKATDRKYNPTCIINYDCTNRGGCTNDSGTTICID